MSGKVHPVNIEGPPLEVSPITIPPPRHWPIPIVLLLQHLFLTTVLTKIIYLKVLHISPQGWEGKYRSWGRVEAFKVDGRHNHWLVKSRHGRQTPDQTH